jgi:hypothetical protein
MALTCKLPIWHSWEGPETATGAYGNWCKPAHTVNVVNNFNFNFNNVHPLNDDWVQHLTNVEFAINAAVSTSTTMSPIKATLGFEPTSPTTATFEDNEPNRTLPEQVKILIEMHRFAHDCVKAAQAHMQEAANRHRLPLPFTLGGRC